MTTPVKMNPVRLDDLIDGIVRVHDDVLDQLTGAMVVADSLDEVADHLIGHFVDQARRSGHSWTDIGRAMGVTKQAARKRFAPRDPGEPPDLDPNQGFSRFTPAARNVVVVAQNEAQAAGHTRIVPGHLVLGLLAEPGELAVQAIEEQGPGLDDVRSAAAATLPPSAEGEAPALVPFDERAKKVLELTFREALRLEHRHVGTEHILLALLDEEGGQGILSGLGIDKRAAEAYVAGRLPGDEDPAPDLHAGDAGDARTAG
jgi:hypothetical protein